MWRLIMGSSFSSEEDAVGVAECEEVSGSDSVFSPAREQGDGMERPPAVQTSGEEEAAEPAEEEEEEKVLEVAAPLVSGGPVIRLPEAGLVLTKLPPIRDTVSLPPAPQASPPVLCPARLYPRGSYPPSHRRGREAKFVPYEPYRGAVAFMENKPAKKPPLLPKRAKSVEAGEGEGAAASPAQEISPELETNYRVMLDVKEAELARLRAAVEAGDKQLKIQTKVNEEVKRLLVASVGEDIEARVEFLTQDKARLAADVLEYNNRIASDWERKEELGVEKDVWRSKFLASSVIVDELTRTKASCVSRLGELEHAARRLLVERGQLRQNLAATQQLLAQLVTAYDPAGGGGGGPHRAGAELDSVQCAEQVARTASQLSTRLLGSRPALAAQLQQLAGLHVTADTPAEAELRRLLGASRRPLEGSVPAAASTALASTARPHLLKLGDLAASPTAPEQFRTCSHCSGTVHTV